MLQVYKILNGIHRLDPDIYIFSIASGSNTRGNSQKIAKSQARLGMKHNVFSQRVVNDWNLIPAQVVESTTVNTFKSRLDNFWQGEKFRLP